MSKARDPMPEAVQDRPIVKRKIWKRMHVKDKNWMGIVCGETGSGKSEFGLRLCEILDPDFGPEQIAFTVEEFIRLVEDRSYGAGSMILFDEVGIALSHAKHYEEELIRVNHVLQSWREQNRGLVMTAPHLGLVHKSDRGLLHGQMDMQSIDYERYMSRARYRNIIQDTDSGDLYKPYPKLRDPADGIEKKHRFMNLFKPSASIVDEYLERKIEFNNELNEKVLEQVKFEEDEEMTLQDVVEKIKSDGVDGVTSVHGGRNTTQIDQDLIRAKYDLSLNDSRAVKKLLVTDEEVAV